MQDSPTPWDRARAAALALARLELAAQEARRHWSVICGTDAEGPAAPEFLILLGRMTMAMVAAERAAVVAAEIWQAAIVERASMPEAERWSVAAAQTCARVELAMGVA